MAVTSHPLSIKELNDLPPSSRALDANKKQEEEVEEIEEIEEIENRFTTKDLRDHLASVKDELELREHAKQQGYDVLLSFFSSSLSSLFSLSLFSLSLSLSLFSKLLRRKETDVFFVFFCVFSDLMKHPF